MNFNVTVDPEDSQWVNISDDRPEAALCMTRHVLVHVADALSDGSIARHGFGRYGIWAEITDGCLYIGDESGDRIGIDDDHIPALIEAIRGVG